MKRNRRNWVESLTRNSVTVELLKTSGRRITDDAVPFSWEVLNLLHAVYQEGAGK